MFVFLLILQSALFGLNVGLGVNGVMTDGSSGAFSLGVAGFLLGPLVWTALLAARD